jgi:hypothetical protein
MPKFDINDIRKVLGWGSQKAPALIDDVLEEAGPLANRVSSEAAEVAPQVLGKGQRAAGKADDVIDAAFSEVGEGAAKKKPQMVDIMALLGLGGVAGGAMMLGSGDDEQPPVPPMAPRPIPEPQAPEQILPDNYNALAQEEALDPQYVSEAPVIQPRQPAAAPVEQAPAPQEVDFVRMLEAAQREASGNRNSANMLRSSELLGAGLARITPEHGSSKIAMDQAGQPVEDVKAKFGAHKEQQSFDKARSEMNDDKKMRDPNSEVSKTTREQFAKFGIKVNTAQDAKQLNPQIFNLLLADRAEKSRERIAEVSKESKANKTEKDLNEKQRKFGAALRKEATSGQLGKMYTNFASGQRALNAFGDFIKKPSGYKDYGMLSSSLRSLQGDDSVIREAELRIGKNATSAINKGLNYMDELANGRSLQPEQRQEMLDAVKVLTESSKNTYMSAVSPILKQATVEGIPHELILDDSLPSSPNQTKDLTTPSAGKTVKVRRISDGVVKELPEASAAKMDKSKYEIL